MSKRSGLSRSAANMLARELANATEKAYVIYRESLVPRMYGIVASADASDEQLGMCVDYIEPREATDG